MRAISPLLACVVVAIALLILIQLSTLQPTPHKAEVPPTLGYTITPKDTVIVLSPHLRLRVTFAQ